jgi:hypothetical protein
MENIEHRVVKLEFKADLHSQLIETLQSNSKDLKHSLQAIEKTLLQIKWLAIGAGVVLTANEFGIIKAFKIVLGLF